MRRATESVWSLLEPEVTGLGYEFVGALFGQAENGMTLRVYIDTLDTAEDKNDENENEKNNKSKKGIVLDDCAKVSRQISALLDVENVIDVAYLLEVSSPGLDRPLFTVEQFQRQIGAQVRIKMNSMVSKRRKFSGAIVAVEDNRVIVEHDEQPYSLTIDDMESARLVPSI